MDMEEENAILDIIDDDDDGGCGGNNNNNNKLSECFLHTNHYSATWHVLTQLVMQTNLWVGINIFYILQMMSWNLHGGIRVQTQSPHS